MLFTASNDVALKLTCLACVPDVVVYRKMLGCLMASSLQTILPRGISRVVIITAAFSINTHLGANLLFTFFWFIFF